jgi:hypothetical protein
MEARKTEYGPIDSPNDADFFLLSTLQTYVSITPFMTSAGRHSVSSSYRSQQGNSEVLILNLIYTCITLLHFR